MKRPLVGLLLLIVLAGALLAACGEPDSASPPALSDSDGDGIPDDRDMCPGTPSTAPVDQSGCPTDADSDGIPDYLDRCPGSTNRVDRSGCEIPGGAPLSLDEIINRQFTPGTIVYNPPTPMEAGRTEDVTVRIGGTTGAKVDARIVENLIGRGEPVLDTLDTGRVMSVTLCCGPPGEAGHPFAITSRSSERQALRSGALATWLFRVTPLSAGEHPLDLRATVHITLPDGREENIDLDRETFRRTIRVDVDPGRELLGELRERWVEVTALVLGALVVLVVSLRGRGGRSRVQVLPPLDGVELDLFISYRRNDSAADARQISATLADTFGREHVFMDVHTIAPGGRFKDAIEDAIARCGALVVLIGDNWLDEDNQARLHEEEDYVRLEIASALARGVPIVPALVAGAILPTRDALPAVLQPLLDYNAIELRHASFDDDVARLVEALVRLATAAPEKMAGE